MAIRRNSTIQNSTFVMHNYSVLSLFSDYCLSFLCVLCDLCGKVKITNKPIFKTRKITLSPLNLWTTNNELRTAKQKNKPKSSPPAKGPVPRRGEGVDSHRWFKKAKNGTVWDKFGVFSDNFGVILGAVWHRFGLLWQYKNTKKQRI